MSRLDVAITEVFKFDELSDDAKEKARAWYRRGQEGDNFFAETPTEEFAEALKVFGFDVSKRAGRHPEIYWSGFSSQGDGACFVASWSAANVKPDKLAAFIDDRPEQHTDKSGKVHKHPDNKKINDIALEFLALSVSQPDGFGHTESMRGNNMRVDSDFSGYDDDVGADEADEENNSRTDAPELETRFAEACNSAAHWFYCALEREYQYQNSDETVDENIRCNEYEFLDNGCPA